MQCTYLLVTIVLLYSFEHKISNIHTGNEHRQVVTEDDY